jgi:hypothetical protein
MKLNWMDCRNILEALNFYLKNGQFSDYKKRELTRLIETLKPLEKVDLTADTSIEFEKQVQQDLIDCGIKEREAREKLEKVEKIKRNVSFVVFYQFTTIVKCALLILLASAGIYTLTEIVPREWAVWAPIPLITIGFAWSFIDEYVRKQGMK